MLVKMGSFPPGTCRGEHFEKKMKFHHPDVITPPFLWKAYMPRMHAFQTASHNFGVKKQRRVLVEGEGLFQVYCILAKAMTNHPNSQTWASLCELKMLFFWIYHLKIDKGLPRKKIVTITKVDI